MDPTGPTKGPHDAPRVVPPAPSFYKPAGVALGIAILPWVLAGSLWLMSKLAPTVKLPDELGYATMVVLLASPFVALIVAGVVVLMLRRMPDDVRPGGLLLARIARGVALGTIVAGAFYACVGMTIARGRQLHRRGKPRTAPLTPRIVGNDGGARTSCATIAPPLEGAERVADAWRKNALTEHASVAAFSHVALDLIAVGAPTSMVRACHEDALDEVAHTELCLAIASSIDGASCEVAAFPIASERPRTMTLERVAVEALIEGALLEGSSAHVAVSLAQRATHPSIKSALATIARDEKRHAEHGWDVVTWCLARDPSLASALHAALEAMPRDLDAPAVECEALGIASHATLRAAHERSLAETRARLAPLTSSAMPRTTHTTRVAA